MVILNQGSAEELLWGSELLTFCVLVSFFFFFRRRKILSFIGFSEVCDSKTIEKPMEENLTWES